MSKRSPRLLFTQEERTAPELKKAIRKADKRMKKLEKAEAKIPKKTVKKKQRVVDPKTGTVTTRLSFEEVDKKRPPSKLTHALRDAPGAAALSAVHREIREHEQDNVGVESAHGVEQTAEGSVLLVSGADLMDGTPIYDIKPYLPYADCKPEASGGFAPQRGKTLAVDFPAELLSRVPEDKRDALTGVLAQDPRPHYQSDPQRVYGMAFAGLEVRFRVADGAVYVVEVTEERDG